MYVDVCGQVSVYTRQAGNGQKLCGEKDILTNSMMVLSFELKSWCHPRQASL